MPGGVSPRPGKFRMSEVPYLREIAECLEPAHGAERIPVMKGAQLGFTILGIGWMGYLAATAPGPAAVFQPTDGLAKGYMRTKWNPVQQASPGLSGIMRPQKRASADGSTTLFRVFEGGFCMIGGANSSAALQMYSLERVMKDELTEWEEDVGGRGDPSDQVDTRTDAYQESRKIFEPSTPGRESTCRITVKFEEGDQRRYQVSCPHCGHEQVLLWERLRYREEPPHGAEYECADCHALIAHSAKRDMLARGRWVPAAPGRPPSFAINQLYSPFTSWDGLVEKWLNAKGKPRREKVFCQQVRGEAWKDGGDPPPWKELHERREDYPLYRIPPGCVVLTAGGDVQGDRIEVEVVAWNRRLDSWSIAYDVIEGNTALPQVWADLDAWLGRKYEDSFGRMWPIDMMAIDSGFQTKNVYKWARPKTARVMACKGVGNPSAPYLSRGKRQQILVSGRAYGVGVWMVGTYSLKADLYDLLRLAWPDDGRTFDPGFCHFPKSYPETYFEGLTAESLVESMGPAGLRKKWLPKPGVPNEPLDVRVLNMAAAERLGLDYKPASWWADRLAERGVPAIDDPSDLPLFGGPSVEVPAVAVAGAGEIEDGPVARTPSAPAGDDDAGSIED